MGFGSANKIYVKFSMLISEGKRTEYSVTLRCQPIFQSNRAFANKHVDKKVLFFNKTVLNILRNFIPHEVIVYDGKGPPWFNGKIWLINEKHRTCSAYRKNISNSKL